jgi:hypothetical protein
MKLRRPQLTLLLIALAAGAAVALGCSSGGTEGGCGSIASCGGDPTGEWQVDGVCQYAPPQPDQPLSFPEYTQQPQDPTIPPPQPQPTTSGSWCSGLVYNPPGTGTPEGAVANVTLWHEPATFTSGTMSFTADHKYDAELVLSTQSSTYFPVSCLQANGFSPTCKQLQRQLNTFFGAAAMLKHAQSAYQAPKTADPAAGIQCAEMTDGGCICDYTYQVTVSDTGAWASNGSLLSFTTEAYAYNAARNTPNAPTFPVLANYCASGNRLSLSGNAGVSLSGVVGLRTMTLRKM